MRVISKARLKQFWERRGTRTQKVHSGRGIRTSTAGAYRGNLGQM